MDKKTRLIIIGVLSIIIVILLSLGLTKAFMKPVEQGGNLTEISLESCAKIKLTGTSSINLSSSYPMSRNRGLQTTPYSLTVTSYCDSYVGFNLYIATLNTNTLTDENIHYILTEKGSKTAVVEGILSSATDGSSDFSDTDKTELNTGLKGTYGSIYKIHNTTVDLKGNKQYDLYLFVDESSTNTSMNKTFKAGVAVKAYDRERSLADWVIAQYNGVQGNNNIYYHDSSLTNGAGDNSYRYAGGDYVLTDAGKATGATMMIGYDKTVTTALIDFYCNGTKQFVGYADHCETHYYLIKGDTTEYQTYNEALNASVEKRYLTKDNVKNFVCFGSEASPCPTENLYRIIGVFNNQVKLIKWDYAKSSLLGTDGDFSQEYSYYFSGEQGESPSSNSMYYWNKATSKNTWSESNLNKANLNTNFITNIGTTWANKIATTTWKVGGNTWANIGTSVPQTAYQNEIVSPDATNSTDNKTEYSAKIGLMYVSDYYYAASPNKWTLVGYNSDYTKSYQSAKGENWIYGGGYDWTISRNSDDSNFAFLVVNSVGLNYSYVGNYYSGVRPSFNLLSSINYVSGSGSMRDPVRIN
jgi:hypothetical protein